MANVGDTLTHCTGTGVEADPYIYNTVDGFLEAINVFNAYVEAGVDNLIFDALEMPASQIEFKCKQIDGKNTSIRNLLANNESKTLISLYASTNYNIIIKNMNFFNMTVISNSSDIKPKIIGIAHGELDITLWEHEFHNCNFTAVLMGSPHTDAYIHTRGHSPWYKGSYYFNGCSFNFVLKFNSGVLGSVSIFRQLESDYIHLNNCALKFSGEALSDTNLYLLDGVKATDCVLLNSQTSPLENKSDGRIIINLTSDSGYNYMKMYITMNGGSLTLDNCNTLLVNKSKIDDPSKISGTCILMQEEDPTANDYIYNETNLSNAGFLIGTVVE